MTDPYQVLGISPNTTDDQVKSAYRELARKYHPDNYADNPLADLATDKMKEINEAYDIIMTQRKSGSASGQSAPGGQYQSTRSSQFADIRRMINEKRIAQAQELLDGVAVSSRDAEWHFLKGSIYYSQGWMDEAIACFQKAHHMDPQNEEYAAAYKQLFWQSQTGRPRYAQASYPNGSYGSSCDCCDICAALYCCNCLCRGCS